MERILNGKKVTYTHLTEFRVQVGYGSKGSYKTRYTLMGSLDQALMYYEGINIGLGYKKRLCMWVNGSDNRYTNKVLVKDKS